MVWCQSLPYIAAYDSRVLILGSMPGVKSLQAGEYYAHPQNHFWPLIYDIMELPLPESYTIRCQGLLKHSLAIWDVIASCYREGSSDANITNVTVNDFPRFIDAHPHLRLIAFNGSKAAQSWRRHVPFANDEIHLITLPSTSPAHTRPLAEKIKAWSVIKEYI